MVLLPFEMTYMRNFCYSFGISVILAAGYFVGSADAASPGIRELRHSEQIAQPKSRQSPPFVSYITAARTADFSDLLLSETVFPAAFEQRHLSLVRIAGDRMLAVWQDDRRGSAKVYAQIFDGNGVAVGSNLLVLGRSDGYDLLEPKACSDGSGGFYLAYRDIMTGRIYFARYNSSLAQTISPRAVNDTISFNYAGPYDIAGFADGRLVAVWEEYSTANNIAMKIFNANGQPATLTIKVNSDSNDAHHWSPAVAIGGTSSIAVVWEDYRLGNPDIYMRLFNSVGVPSGDDFSVIELTSADSSQYLPDIAYSSVDGYAVAWLDKRADSQKVYLQRVVPGSGLTGGNRLISASSPEVSDWDISLAVNAANTLVASWAAVGTFSNIMVQRFSAGFALNGAAIVANQEPSGGRWESCIAVGPSDKIFCGWSDARAHHTDLYLRGFSSDGAELFSGDRLINDDAAGAQSTEPEIALLNNSQGAIAFTDQRFDEGDIFLQLVNSNGSIAGGNQKVNTDMPPAFQREPSIAASASRMAVVWSDGRAVGGVSGSHIFGRFGDNTGLLENSDFMISDENEPSPKVSPAVALSGDSGLAVWVEKANPEDQVIGRMISTPSNTIGAPFLISDTVLDLTVTGLSAISDRDGNFVVVYLTYRPAATLVMARYSSQGNFLGKSVYTSALSNIYMTDISAAIGMTNQLIVLWQGEAADQSRHIYLSRFSTAGAVLTAPFEISVPLGAGPDDIDVSADANGYVVATWTDSRSGRRAVYYQVYSAHLNARTAQNLVSNISTEYMISAAAANGNWDGWIAWVDPRSAGKNVYLTQFNYLSTDIADTDEELLPHHFSLKQNYPNPFNSSTTIEFDLPQRGEVQLEIFNLLGMKIRTVIDRALDAGRYQFSWDGRDNDGKIVASGLYFYRMKSDRYSSVRKMILLK
jgi:hypothetical protein